METGTFAELAREFDAGEGYEKWYFAADWAPYRGHFDWASKRVAELAAAGADASLLELAEKQLLVSNWETAWHTPPNGPHGDATQNGHASPWARALTSHSRLAAVTAEAAHWMRAADGLAHAAFVDLDCDGERELVLKNRQIFAVVAPRWGARVVALYRVAGDGGAMLVGNPCDDWNWMEELNRYMDTPRNHPGAYADVGMEHEPYAVECSVEAGREVSVTLHSARGIVKEFSLTADAARLRVRYRLPAAIEALAVEFGLSPDYLRLLREGSRAVRPLESDGARGCAAGGVAVWVRPEPGLEWTEPRQSWIGHGWMLAVLARRREFAIDLGSAPVEAEPAGAPRELETALL
jgi:hypothetical protein